MSTKTAIEVIERLRPKHIFDSLGNHILNDCDGCQFDKAVTDLIKEAVIREREACAESHLRKVINKILEREDIIVTLLGSLAGPVKVEPFQFPFFL